MLFAAVLSVDTSVGDSGWTIHVRAILTDVAFWQFSNDLPKYASVADSMKFIIMLQSTCTDTFSGGISCIGVLDFCPRKNIHLLCFVHLVLICRMHPNICG